MKVLLIDPRSINRGSLNIGLAYVATVLHERGHKVKVLDFNCYIGNEEKRLFDALAWVPDIITISIFPASIPTYEEARKIVTFCKRNQKKDTCYIAGGPGVTLEPEKFMQENKNYFNFGIVNEGEFTLAELIDSLEKGGDFQTMPGLVFYSGEKIIRTEDRPFIKELDKLPFPDYRLFDSVGSRKIVEYPLITSRGCPFNCIFCLNKELSKRRWRGRSADNVVSEMEVAVKKYDSSFVYIWDDHFSLDVKRAVDICKLKIEREINIPYYLPDGIRADSVTDELAALLKKSNCLGVSVGFEDANPLTYKYVDKGEKFEDIVKGIKILQKAGVPVRVSMIIGLPHTTYQTTKKAMEFVKTLGVHAEWYLAIPFPGTQLYKWVEDNGRFLENPLSKAALTFREVVFDTPDFLKDDRLKAFYQANMDYSSPEKAFYDHTCQPLYQKDSLYEIFIGSYKIVWKYNRRALAKHTLRLVQYLSRALKRKFKIIIHKDSII